MSSSHSEPENAAPTALVRPEPAEQGPENSQDGGLDKSRRWAPASRPSSTSLLTQALAASQEAERRASRPSPSPEALASSAQSSSHPAEEQTDKDGLSQAGFSEHLSAAEMAIPTPGLTGDARRSLNTGIVPASLHDRHDRHVTSLPVNHRELSNGARARGTSLERTEKEKRVQDSPKGSYSTNPGDTALAPSPVRRNPAPSEPISNNQPTEGVRAKYRSWRDSRTNMAAEKAWSICEQGDDDGEGGRVEKSITQAMAGVEPNNRSRKASHSLGFFKEGLPEDRSKKREHKRKGRSKEGSSPTKGSGALENGKQRLGHDTHTRDSIQDFHKPDLAADGGTLLPPLLEEEDYSSKPLSKQMRFDSASNQSPGLVADDGSLDRPGNPETAPKEQIRRMPPQLLAGIRKHHNLTPGAAKGTSFSRSLPVTESERPKDDNDDEQEVKPSSSVQNEEEGNDGAELSLVKSTDDEDESGEEQISCALFVPHQTPHDSPEGENSIFESVTSPPLNNQRRLDVPKPQQWLEEHEVPSRDLSKKYLSQEAKPRRTPSPIYPKLPSPRAEKEGFFSEHEDGLTLDQETPDDGGYTTAGEESYDDHDITPTGSVKQGNQIPSGYDRHIHVHQQKQPLEAIELIPYRHQVGGHTTLWRFSKRAVCKQLNNRENEFYEKIERYHPQLLKFLPRCV